MSNPYLILVTVILSLAIVAASIYLVIYFQHPEDKLVAWVPKIIVVVGMTLACFSILMLPLDVANQTTNGGFPMQNLWLSIYIIIAVLVVVIIPAAMFYYEADEIDEEGNSPSQLKAAIIGTLITLGVFVVVTAVMWIFLGIAEVAVANIKAIPFTTVKPTRYELCNNQPLFKNNSLAPEFYYEYSNSQDDEYNETKWEDYLIDQCIMQFINGSCTQKVYEYVYPAGVFANNGTYPNGTVGNKSVLILATVNASDPVNVTEFGNFTNLTCVYPPYTIPNVLKDVANNITKFPSFTRTVLKIRVSIGLYIITMVVFFGYVLFIIFGGVGLVAFPMDNIKAFLNRPIRIPLDVYLKKKLEIGERATKLIGIGKALKDKQRKQTRQRRRDRKNYNKFRQAVYLLEEDYERLQLCYKRQGGKILLYYGQLVLGVISVVLTICWLLQMILYVFTYPFPFFPFLNSFVIALDDAWGLLGTIAYGLFAFYLLLCCIKGNFKFGLRVFFLFPIHPMKVGNTMMNSFLFNTGLILICSVAIGQFCTTAFADYTNATAIATLFNVAVRNMMGIRYIMIGYMYAFFAMVILSGIYFAARPRDKPAPIIL